MLSCEEVKHEDGCKSELI